MKRTWGKGLTLLRTAVALYVSYRAAVVIWMLHGIVPLITMFIWMQLANEGPVSGMNATDFAAYFLAVFVVSQITAGPIIGALEIDIRSGALSPKLLLPIDPSWGYLATKMAYTIIGLPFFAVPVCLVLLATDVNWNLAPLNLLAALAATLGAVAIHFHLLYSLGLIAFWTDKAMAVAGVWESLDFVFSGSFAPIYLFPAFLKQVAGYLPFAYTVYFPAQILVGDLAGEALWQGFAVQATWILLLLALRKLLWRYGLKRYGAVGA